MHEFSTVKNIVERVVEVAEKEGAKEILQIEVGVGEFTLLEIEQMKFWLEMMLNSTEIGKSAKIVIHQIDGIIQCGDCRYKGGLKTTELDHLFPILRCPECKGYNLKIIEGDDCLIKSMEIEN
ncbi:hydrogenase maturation nickel metallochaperone HypA [candidate division WOR-3 bacterium]|nr:hydrogenase maturation nickel metallochaperone HypA [candidate division WOR-3 bacterium]